MMESFIYITTITQLIFMLVLSSNPELMKSVALNITTDKEALVSFKSQIIAEVVPNPLSTWDLNISPCNWSGVSCNHRGQRVVGLDLSGLRIRGSISPYLGNLSFLRTLELQNNQFTGELPNLLGSLFRLQTLNFSLNSFEGVIPSNISRCRELRVLDLMQNRISGHIPEEITFLTQLQVLNLARNRFSGALPRSLGNISSLVNLNLRTNNLVGPIPSEFAGFVNLKFLDLSVNNLSGTVPLSIYNSTTLEHLALASNNLWGELPGDIAFTMPNLLGIIICFNKFTGLIPWSLHNLTNIKIIRMGNNLLHGSIPPGLGNLPNLEMYNIGFNSIVSRGKGGLDFLEMLTNSTRLNYLAIHFNLLEGEIPKSVGNLSKVLTMFYMGGNNIYGTIPPSICELRSLRLLNLSTSSLSGEIPQEIGQLNQLSVLGLADNMLSGTIPNSLGNLRLLTKIDLSKNELVGHIPNSFGNFQTLISMDLSNNKLNGSIPAQVLNIPGLNAFLNLSQNQFTGHLPEEIGILRNVVAINISDNKLSGDIPISISNCLSLEQLLLARNMFSGEIPNSLGSVRGLETLDLSSNQLSGAIPENLQKLTSLQLLNLSFNTLAGVIPTGGIFTSPSRVYLESNQNLCSGLFPCNVPQQRRSTFVYVAIGVVALVALIFAIGCIVYTIQRKQGTPNKGLFESIKAQHEMVSYKEICLATESFNEENLIGRGSFGHVYKGVLRGANIAVKVLDAALARSRKSFLAECAAFRNVRHRNLVKLVTICSSIDSRNDEFLALVFDFMSNGSLDDWLTGKRKHENGMGLNIHERLSCAIGIASAIDYLHNETELSIVHCDLKPSNVLLDSDMTPKVSDFGLAKIFSAGKNNKCSISSTHTLRGSIGYIPPEEPTSGGDVYSYGILLLQLFTGKSPTSEIFTGGVSLKSWVQNKLISTNLNQVLDFGSVQEMDNLSEIERKCIMSVLGVGLSCAVDSLDARLSIRDALHKLKTVEVILDKPEFVGHEQINELIMNVF